MQVLKSSNIPVHGRHLPELQPSGSAQIQPTCPGAQTRVFVCGKILLRQPNDGGHSRTPPSTPGSERLEQLGEHTSGARSPPSGMTSRMQVEPGSQAMPLLWQLPCVHTDPDLRSASLNCCPLVSEVHLSKTDEAQSLLSLQEK